jgi:integrase
MWIEETNSGKFKFIERYFDPLTEKQKKVSIVMDKNTASTRKLAFEELQRKISQKLDTINSSNTTLSQLKDKYLAYQKKTVKLSTWERNSRTLEVLTDLIGPAAIVDKLTAQYVKDALLTRTEQPGTLNEYITRLKAMLRWGYQNDLMENIRLIDKLQPFKDISHREKIKYKYLEPDELDSLLKYMEQRPYYTWYYVTAILVLSGLRIGELTALHTEDIDDYIHVTKTYDAINKVVTTPKTAMSVRDVYIQPELHTVLQRYDRYIYLTEKGHIYPTTPMRST